VVSGLIQDNTVTRLCAGEGD